MPIRIENHYVNDYTNNIQLLLQQKSSKLRPYVTEEHFEGENAAFMEQVGSVAVNDVGARHGPTPLNPTPHDRRWIFPSDKDVADLVDSEDKLRMAIDPTSSIAQAQAAAFARSFDDLIIEAAYSPAQTGKTPTTLTVPFPAANKILHGLTGMTVDKLREVHTGMEDDDVDFDEEMPIAVITPQQKKDLLSSVEVTSSDYNAVKALVNGDVDTFMGFKFITSNRLLGASKYAGSLTPTANIHTAIFFVKSGLGFGSWQEMIADISVRNDLRNSVQIYCKATYGATRLEEGKVWLVESDHTP